MSAIRCSEHPSINAGEGNTPLSFVDLAEIARYLGRHTVTLDKHGVPLLSAAQFASPQDVRNDANVVRMGSVFVADFDALRPAETVAVLKSVDGVSRIFYTSHNHERRKTDKDPGTDRFRLLLELTRETSVAEFLQVRDRLKVLFGRRHPPYVKGVDPWLLDARPASQPYYLPSTPPDGRPLLAYAPGNPLDVDTLLRATLPMVEFSPEDHVLELDDLQAWRMRLRRRITAHAKRLERLVSSLLAGEALAEQGQRDNTLFILVAAIVEEFPTVVAESVAEIFAPSLAQMAGDDPIGLDVIVDKVHRQRAHLASVKHDEAQAKQHEREQLILASTEYQRAHPATDDELDRAARRMRVRTDALRQYLVVGRQSWFHIMRPDGSYGPATHASDLVQSAKRDLAIYDDIPLQLETREGGLRDRMISEVRSMGDVAKALCYDLTAQQTTYDPHSQTITIAPCPERVTPAYDPIIDELLRVMGGEVLLDWVAACAQLHMASSALILTGDSGVGKSWLTEALARIWTVGGPSRIGALSEKFNFELTKCPLVAAQEKMDAEYYRSGSAYLRDQVARLSRSVEEKYHPVYTLRGAIRVIMTANNFDTLATDETLTKTDMEALAQRILHVPVSPHAVEFWELLTDDERDRIYHGDAAAAHALWLRGNRSLYPSSRFLVQGEQSPLHHRIALGNGDTAQVGSWLLAYLQNPHKLDATKKDLAQTRDGKLYVTSQALIDYWDMYAKTNAITANRIGRALSSLSGTVRRQLRAGINTLNYYEIAPEKLAPLLELCDLPEEAFNAAFQRSA